MERSYRQSPYALQLLEEFKTADPTPTTTKLEFTDVIEGNYCIVKDQELVRLCDNVESLQIAFGTEEDQKVVVIEKDGAMLKLAPEEYKLIRSADTQFQSFFDLTLTETMEPGTAPSQSEGANVVSNSTNNRVLLPAPHDST